MGKVLDVLKGVALPEQKKRQILALDAEFDEMQSRNQNLEAQLLRAQAEINPAKREIERLKARLSHKELPKVIRGSSWVNARKGLS